MSQRWDSNLPQILQLEIYDCRVEAPVLETVKLFVDAGWFLDIPSYSNRSDGMTFEKCAKALPASYGAVFDRCWLPPSPSLQSYGPKGLRKDMIALL